MSVYSEEELLKEVTSSILKNKCIKPDLFNKLVSIHGHDKAKQIVNSVLDVLAFYDQQNKEK